eukprot:2148398-Pyramimonas_sp.AAC.1
METPPGHLALKVDEYDAATAVDGATAFTATSNPQREETPVLIKGPRTWSRLRGNLLQAARGRLLLWTLA